MNTAKVKESATTAHRLAAFLTDFDKFGTTFFAYVMGDLLEHISVGFILKYLKVL